MLQNTPSCAIDKKSAWGVCSNTPKYSVHNNTLSIIFLYKNEYFYNFVFTKILTKYSPKRTKLHHFFNLLGGAYPRTPLACNTIHNHANTPTLLQKRPYRGTLTAETILGQNPPPRTKAPGQYPVGKKPRWTNPS